MNNKVTFKIDKELDFENHLIGARMAINNSLQMSPEISEYFRKLRDADGKGKKKIFEERTAKFYSDGMKDFRSLLVKQAKDMWNLVEDKYFDKIEKIHKKTFPLESISAILSTTPTVYGYNFDKGNPWFACTSESPIKAIHTAMHEIMHVYFNEYFLEECKNKFQLNNEQIYTVKEAVTVILNIEFEDIRMFTEKDRPGHEQIREKIGKDWLEYRDLRKVLDEAYNYIKKGE